MTTNRAFAFQAQTEWDFYYIPRFVSLIIFLAGRISAIAHWRVRSLKIPLDMIPVDEGP